MQSTVLIKNFVELVKLWTQNESQVCLMQLLMLQFSKSTDIAPITIHCSENCKDLLEVNRDRAWKENFWKSILWLINLFMAYKTRD
jgi:predicted nucleic acid-binding Zn ribbon protein